LRLKGVVHSTTASSTCACTAAHTDAYPKGRC
jgi:hypothetical protein